MSEFAPIAIVGAGCRLPGAQTPEAFWDLVVSGASTARPVPAERWGCMPYDGEAAIRPDRVRGPNACLLDGEVPMPALGGWDAKGWARLDPAQQLTVHTSVQAWQDCRTAGVDPLRCGVIAGQIALPSASASQQALALLGRALAERMDLGADELDLPHLPAGIAAGRTMGQAPALAAHALGLGGPAFALDAACASSLYALKLACDRLQSGETDLMLAGGTGRADQLYTQMGFSQLGALSPSGTCAPFTDRADGLLVGEGSVMLACKRLADAIAHGDTIHAVIRGIGISNDRDCGLFAPAQEGQERAVRAAYAMSGWSPADVGYIECHGTGTPTGDRVELASLSAVWRDAGVTAGTTAIGSAKATVGHLLTGAGAVGVLKVLTSFAHGTLPPAPHAGSAVAELDDSPFRLPTTAGPWASDAPRRAAVSAFGFGGINAHVLLEAWNDTSPAIAPAATPALRDEQEAVVVCAVGARSGAWPDAEAFRHAVFAGTPLPAAQPDPLTEIVAGDQWLQELGLAHLLQPGQPLDEQAIDLAAIRIPPKELAALLPQQAAMLAACADAVAGIDLGEPTRRGGWFAIDCDQRSTTWHVRWLLRDRLQAALSRRRREQGHADSAAETAAFIDRVLDALCPALDADHVMGSLGGIVASRCARAWTLAGQCFALSQEAGGGLRALDLAARALRRGEVDTALVGGVGVHGDLRQQLADRLAGPWHEGAVSLLLMRARTARERGVPTIAELGDSREARSGERAALASVVPDGSPVVLHGDPDFDFDSARWRMDRAVGDLGAAAGIAATAIAAWSIQHSLLPAGDGCRQPSVWLGNRADGPRTAAAVVADIDGALSAQVVREHAAATAPQPLMPADEPQLMMLEAATHAELAERLRSSDHLPANAVALPASTPSRLDAGAARAVFLLAPCDDWIAARDQALALLTGHSVPGRRMAWVTPRDWQPGTVAACWPGSGNHFAGMGAALARRLPMILHRQQQENEHLAAQFCDGQWFADAVPTDLPQARYIMGQVTTGTLGWDALQVLGVAAQQLVPHSLGESALLFSTRTWRDRDAMWRRVNAGTLFSEDLGAPYRAVQAYLDTDEPVDWRICSLPLPAEDVRAGIQACGRGDVWLGIVNAPRECVAVGTAAGVHALQEALGVRGFELSGITSVHAPVLTPVEQAYHDLHVFPVHPLPSATYYSCSLGRSYEPETQAIAESIVANARDGFDYQRLIEQVYADGARVFIDCGPGHSCARLVDRILGARPHVALALQPDVTDPNRALLAAVAQLLAVGVEVDVAGLYPRMQTTPQRPIAYRPRVPDLASVRKDGESLRRSDSGAQAQRSHRCATLPGSTASAGGPSGGGTPDRDAPHPTVATAPPDSQSKSKSGSKSMTTNASPPSEAVANTTLQAVPNPAVHPPAVQALLSGNAATGRAHERFFALVRDARQALLGDPATASDPTAAAAMAIPVAEPERIPTADPREFLVPGGMISEDGHFYAACPDAAYDRPACLEAAVGSIGRMLGPDYAAADRFPTRVRLPAPPLMLVDRILAISGDRLHMGTGRIVTQHVVQPGAWYLDHGCIPTGICVESGQADLFLAGWLGIDHQTRGEASYRLLDAQVTFHRGLPGPGAVITYDIHGDGFTRQGDIWLYRFHYDATVDEGDGIPQPLLSMRGGTAGFFSDADLAAGVGIVHSRLDRLAQAGEVVGEYRDLLPLAPFALGEQDLAALRRGNLAAAYGADFAGLPLQAPTRLPDGRLHLVDRITGFQPGAGKYGLGEVTGELDIHSDDWFIVCHFPDDPVMPGTLMYECCMHVLRTWCLRMGWVGEHDDLRWEPVPGVASSLKCRGQVLPGTRQAGYRIVIKRYGYLDDGTPFVIGDAHMFADDKEIVLIADMSLCVRGLTREGLEALWTVRSDANAGGPIVRSDVELDDLRSHGSATLSGWEAEVLEPFADTDVDRMLPALYDEASIIAYSDGLPSEAFGDPYRPFDHDRVIARLPRDPYRFLDGVVTIRDCEPFVMKQGGQIVAQYDLPVDAWFFAANRSDLMPFAVLLEVALQPCGWLSAYVGSALCADEDLKYRNLGGTARQLRPVSRASGVLTTHVHMTGASMSGGMIIQHFRMQTRDRDGVVYDGTTYFGFFSQAALANQVGLRDEGPYELSPDEQQRARTLDFPREAPFADDRLRMIDRITRFVPDGGPAGLGVAVGEQGVDAERWFFQAHFKQDPVCPGSLGVEGFVQLMQFLAAERWGAGVQTRFICLAQGEHEWIYRGQYTPAASLVTTTAVVTAVDPDSRTLTADGTLSVDGRPIYRLRNFRVRME